jgi:hypothetical protein
VVGDDAIWGRVTNYLSLCRVNVSLAGGSRTSGSVGVVANWELFLQCSLPVVSAWHVRTCRISHEELQDIAFKTAIYII